MSARDGAEIMRMRPPERRTARCAAVGFSISLFAVVLAGSAGAQGHPHSVPGRSKGAGMSHGNNDDVVPCMHTMTKPEALPSAVRTGKILIQSPADGDVIRSRTVKVTFDVQGKGELDDHIHVYLDGRCQNMIKHGKSYHLSGLREGKHTIELRLVTKEHVEYGPKARVDIVVQHR